VISTVELTAPGRETERAALLDISVCGLAFRVADGTGAPAVGTVLSGATLRVGEREVQGDLLVRNVRPQTAGADLGCLFYPTGPRNERALLALLTALERRERVEAASAAT
jgi:hypothetical protein